MFRLNRATYTLHLISAQTSQEGIGYRKVASSNTSRLEAHTGFFRLPMKGIFHPYVL